MDGEPTIPDRQGGSGTHTSDGARTDEGGASFVPRTPVVPAGETPPAPRPHAPVFLSALAVVAAFAVASACAFFYYSYLAPAYQSQNANAAPTSSVTASGQNPQSNSGVGRLFATLPPPPPPPHIAAAGSADSSLAKSTSPLDFAMNAMANVLSGFLSLFSPRQ